MKKIIFILAMLIIITGCSKKEEKVIEKTKETKIVEDVPNYKDDNPVKLAFYEETKILKEYKTNLTPMTDINVFGTLFTNDEEVINSSFKYQFKKYYEEYPEKDKYKIGYYIKFYTGDTLHEKTITDPTSTFSLQPYLYVYLYDDLHQADGAFYSHIEEKDVNDDTLYTSIKLFMVDKCTDITSPITLEAFTYDDEDDFDENGYYRGNSKYSIEIKTS